MAKVKINLNPSENSLQSGYGTEDEVVVLFDASDSDFTTVMPDGFSNDDNTFRLVKNETSLNVIRIEAKPGQKIMGEDFQELTEPYDELVLSSDGIGNWV